MTATQTPADKKHGYEFGCDGVMDYATAAEKLGVSKRTIERYAEQGRFRSGKHPGSKSVVCRRSINEYMATLEN